MTHKATPEQWATTEEYANAAIGCYSDSCILELRDRIAALEAANQQPEPIDEEENDRRFRACLTAIDNATPEQIRAAVAKASANHFPDATKLVPAPAGGLVERVSAIIINGQACDHDEERTARAAILAVAEWLDAQEPVSLGFPSAWLREEVERG